MAIKKAEKPVAKKPAAPKAKAQAKTALKKAPAKKAKKTSPPATPVDKKPVSKKRGPNKPKTSLASFADFKKKQGELEASKKKAMADFRKSIKGKVKEVDDLKKEFTDLFKEKYDTAPKTNNPKGKSGKAKSTKPRAKRPSQTDLIKAFLELKNKGIEVKDMKIQGTNKTGKEKINKAYEKAETKDVDTILALL